MCIRDVREDKDWIIIPPLIMKYVLESMQMIVFIAHFPLRRSVFDEPSMNMQSSLIIF